MTGAHDSRYEVEDLHDSIASVKDIYEALRAGPKWGKTLFFVVYDDGGAYFDHVPTPVGIPADAAVPAVATGAFSRAPPPPPPERAVVVNSLNSKAEC